MPSDPFGNMYLEWRLAALRGKASTAKPGVKNFLRKLGPEGKAEEAIRMLAEEVAAQRLLIRAMLAYMEASPGFNRAEFSQLLDVIDLEDGELDGKLMPIRKPR
jgi:hypothetical protein